MHEKLITKLTKDQEARFPEFVEKWTKIGLCTDPANRPEAEKGIIEAYKIAGLEAPRIVWCQSPMSQAITRSLVLEFVNKDSVKASVKDSVWDSVGDSVWDSVKASAWDSVKDSVWDSVKASAWDSVKDSVWACVGDSVGASVKDSVWACVGDSVGDSVKDSVWACVGDSVYGQHDCNWLSFYDYFREAVGLKKETQKLNGLFQIAKNAGWFLPHKKICWVSERHNTLHQDEKWRLHHEHKPALTYPDGWALYYLHEVRVPEKYIRTPKEKIDCMEVLKERNAEVRMAVMKKVGYERFFPHIKHKVLSEGPSRGGHCRLIEIESQEMPLRYLHFKWPIKGGEFEETAIPVPATKDMFASANGVVPDKIDNYEQVRRWSLGLDSSVELVQET